MPTMVQTDLNSLIFDFKIGFKNETFLLTLSHCVVLSILYTTFITICPTLFSSKTKSALLENGDISVGFLETPFPFSTELKKKKSATQKRAGLLSKRHTKGPMSIALAFRN